MKILSFCKSVTNVNDFFEHEIIWASDLDIAKLHIFPQSFQALIADNLEVIKYLKFNIDKNVLLTTPLIALLQKEPSIEKIRKFLNYGATDFCVEPYSDLKEIIMKANEKIDAYMALAEENLNQLRKSLLVSIPHEFNTPLTGVVGIASLLAKDPPDETAIIKNFAQKILESVNRLKGLLDNYIYYSYLQLKLSSGNDISYARLFHLQNPDEIAKMAIHEIQYVYRRKICYNTNKDSIICNETNFYKLVYHLLENAVKFSKKDSKVSFDAETINNEYQIKIYNEDSGFSLNQLNMIGPFTQFDRNIKEQQGLGLGLAIVNSILKLYDGHIQINTEKNKYTEIVIYLKTYYKNNENVLRYHDNYGQGGISHENYFN